MANVANFNFSLGNLTGTGECGVLECKKKWLEKVPSSGSIKSTDVECLEKLQELAEAELCMKRQIADLEGREEAYMRTLQQADELWCKLEGDAASTVSVLQEQLEMKTAANQQMAGRICELEDELEKLRSRMATCRTELEKYMSIGKIEALIGRDDDFADVTDKGATVGVVTQDTMMLAKPEMGEAGLGIHPEDLAVEREKLLEAKELLAQLGSLSELDDEGSFCFTNFDCNDLGLTETGLTEEERIALEENRVTARELLEKYDFPGGTRTVKQERIEYRMAVKTKVSKEVTVPSTKEVSSVSTTEELEEEFQREIQYEGKVTGEVYDTEVGDVAPAATDKGDGLVPLDELLSWQNYVHSIRLKIATKIKMEVEKEDKTKLGDEAPIKTEAEDEMGEVIKSEGEAIFDPEKHVKAEIIEDEVKVEEKEEMATLAEDLEFLKIKKEEELDFETAITEHKAPVLRSPEEVLQQVPEEHTQVTPEKPLPADEALRDYEKVVPAEVRRREDEVEAPYTDVEDYKEEMPREIRDKEGPTLAPKVTDDSVKAERVAVSKEKRVAEKQKLKVEDEELPMKEEKARVEKLQEGATEKVHEPKTVKAEEGEVTVKKERAEVTKEMEEKIPVPKEEKAELTKEKEEKILVPKKERAEVTEEEDKGAPVPKTEKVEVIEEKEEKALVPKTEKVEVIEKGEGKAPVEKKEKAEVPEEKEEKVPAPKEEKAEVLRESESIPKTEEKRPEKKEIEDMPEVKDAKEKQKEKEVEKDAETLVEADPVKDKVKLEEVEPVGEEVEVEIIPVEEEVEGEIIPGEGKVEVEIIPAEEKVEVEIIPAEGKVEVEIIPEEEEVKLIPVEDAGEDTVQIVPIEEEVVPVKKEVIVHVEPLEEEKMDVDVEETIDQDVPTIEKVKVEVEVIGLPKEVEVEIKKEEFDVPVEMKEEPEELELGIEEECKPLLQLKNISLVNVKKPLLQVKNSLVNVKKPLLQVKNSLVNVKKPLLQVKKNSLVNVKKPVLQVKNSLVNVKKPVLQVKNSLEASMKMEITQTEITQIEISKTTIQAITQTVADVGMQTQPTPRMVPRPRQPKIVVGKSFDPEPEILERLTRWKKSQETSRITSTAATSQTEKSSILRILQDLKSSAVYSKFTAEEELRSIHYGKKFGNFGVNARCDCCLCGKMVSDVVPDQKVPLGGQTSSVMKLLQALPLLDKQAPGSDQAVQYKSVCTECRTSWHQQSTGANDLARQKPKVPQTQTRDQEVYACGTPRRRTPVSKIKQRSDQSCMAKIKVEKTVLRQQMQNVNPCIYQQGTEVEPKKEDKGDKAEDKDSIDCICTTVENDSTASRKVRCACGDPD
ncbi:PREDICTED: neurofilament medium polypeptide-like [Dufourea novaeangliae]|uniref:neurofilament medium polypeptide-like n=1 Tax=Dufourea novaeangliae TaxID=178035 RepID=UPI00076712DB|nr:PREDICTED: neurofilament medium polypeptide-like [Dufourea novaeangliae]